MKALLPDSRFRSPTAVQDKANMRDENVYSSIIVGHGGSGLQKMFTVPQGQSIPRLVGSAIAPTSGHHLTHTELTTNLSQAGQAGAAIGDFSIRSIGLNFEQASSGAAGALGTYGFGQVELAETLSKTFFQLKIAGRKEIEGPTFRFPAMGGAHGAISSSTTAASTTATSSIATNGWPGAGRRLKIPVLVGRQDTIEGVFGVAGGTSLAFSVTSGAGQCSLLWCTLDVLVKADVR